MLPRDATQAEMEAGTLAKFLGSSPEGVAQAVDSLGSGGASVFGEYRFDSSITDSNPASGRLRLNNATQSAATFIFMSKTSDNGVDVSNFLAEITTNDRIYLQIKIDSGAFVLVKVTGAVTDATGYVKIPITVEDNGTDLLNNSRLLVGIAVAHGTSLGAATSRPYAIRADTSSPSEVTVGEMKTFSLPDASTKGVVSHFDLPSDIDLATTDPVAHYAFICTIEDDGASNGDVRFSLETRYIAAGELVTKTVDETVLQTDAVIDTLGELQATAAFTLDRTAIAVGDHIELHLERLGADGADTYLGEIGIMENVSFQYDRK